MWTLVSVVIFEATTVFQRSRTQKMLGGMAPMPSPIYVYRCGIWTVVTTKLWEETHTPLHQTESKDGLDDIILPANSSFEQRAHALNDFFEDLFEVKLLYYNIHTLR